MSDQTHEINTPAVSHPSAKGNTYIFQNEWGKKNLYDLEALVLLGLALLDSKLTKEVFGKSIGCLEQSFKAMLNGDYALGNPAGIQQYARWNHPGQPGTAFINHAPISLIINFLDKHAEELSGLRKELQELTLAYSDCSVEPEDFLALMEQARIIAGRRL